MNKFDIWIDISNTPQVHVMKSFINALSDYSIYVTGFRRGEVADLLKIYSVKGEVFGSDKNSSLLRSIAFARRSAQLLMYKAPRARVLLSCENAMPIAAAKVRNMHIVLLLDNDLKFQVGKLPFQRIENWLMRMADHVLVPKVAASIYEKFFKNFYMYPGYKEHIYIADYSPDPAFPRKIPFRDYVVVRPESLASLYVQHNKSIVPELLRLLEKEGIRVLYVPRNKEEKVLATGFGSVFIPPNALNGLDLIYYSKATLTGSGTMAREAALLGVPAISFFPGKTLLAVDRELVRLGRIYHSRDPRDIVEYIVTNWNRRRKPCFSEARNVKTFVVNFIREVIENAKSG